ncbi:MAG: VWA domain-containing protein, partial [Vicinamibacterales bacterium]
MMRTPGFIRANLKVCPHVRGSVRGSAWIKGGPRLSLIAAAVCAASIALQAQQQPQAPPELPRPAFDTKTELVLVDVTVVDRDSNPVPTLVTTDFDLQVNGQPRKIESMQFVSAVPTNTTPLTAREATSVSNETATTGRLLLFVVDESNLRTGSSRTVLRTAQTLMDRLAPGDLIGLARLPNGAGNVEFTADRARVTTAMQRITGSINGRLGNGRIRISEAWALENGDTATWESAVDRECQGETGPGREACATAVEGDARSMIIETSARTHSTLQGLEALLKNLAPLKTPVNIVMISEGLFVARDRTSMTELTRRAAEARATIHIIRPGQAAFDIEDRAAPGVSAFYDDSLMTEGLDQIAGQTRGTMTQIGGSPQSAFDRLGRELSGYYLLGFEPTDADRTGKERRIRVQIKPRGLTVRARPTFVIRDAADTTAAATATAAADSASSVPSAPSAASAASAPSAASASSAASAARLRQMLLAPLPTRGLPIRVSSYTATDTGSSKIRVVISAEVGDAGADEVEWPIGVLILDKDDK